MTKNGNNANHDARPDRTPGEVQAAADQERVRFRGCVHDEADADIGHNPDGERVVRIDLGYTRGPAGMTNTFILALDAVTSLRNQLDQCLVNDIADIERLV